MRSEEAKEPYDMDTGIDEDAAGLRGECDPETCSYPILSMVSTVER